MLENFMMCIPNGPLLAPDGKPFMYIGHKEKFAEWFFSQGYEEKDFDLRQREELYTKWLSENPQPEMKWEKVDEKTTRWSRG